MEENLLNFQHRVGKSSDIVSRTFTVSSEPPLRAAALHVEGVADTAELHCTVIRALMQPHVHIRLGPAPTSEASSSPGPRPPR